MRGEDRAADSLSHEKTPGQNDRGFICFSQLVQRTERLIAKARTTKAVKAVEATVAKAANRNAAEGAKRRRSAEAVEAVEATKAAVETAKSTVESAADVDAYTTEATVETAAALGARFLACDDQSDCGCDNEC